MDIYKGYAEGPDSVFFFYLSEKRSAIKPVSFPYAPAHQNPVDGMSPFFLWHSHHHLERTNSTRHCIPKVFLQLFLCEPPPGHSERKFVETFSIPEKPFHQTSMVESPLFGKFISCFFSVFSFQIPLFFLCKVNDLLDTYNLQASPYSISFI